MNNIIFQTIRAVAVLGIAFFAFVDSAFAAPVLTPVVVSNISTTGAVLAGYVSNPAKSTCVWLEWNVGNSITNPTAISRQCFFNGGPFNGTLSNLNPGSTYSYRSAAIDDGGVIMYSSTGSFTTPNTDTPVSSSVSAAVVSTQPIQSVASGQTTQTTSLTTGTTNNVTSVTSQKSTTATPVVKQVTPTPGANGFTNGNSAAVIGAGSGMLPTTLIGWIALLVVMLFAVLIGHMLYESMEKRRIEREEREKREQELEEQAKTE